MLKGNDCFKWSNEKEEDLRIEVTGGDEKDYNYDVEIMEEDEKVEDGFNFEWEQVGLVIWEEMRKELMIIILSLNESELVLRLRERKVLS